MLVLPTLVFIGLALSLEIYASLEIHSRDGRYLENKQHVLISRYVDGDIAQGDAGLQALRQETTSNILTISFALYKLHQRTGTILRMCFPQYASPGQEEFHSFLVPCGMLSGIAVGPMGNEWEIRTVNSASLNITVSHVASVWDKIGCDRFPNLRITDSGRTHSVLNKLDVTICGNSPQQTYFSASSKIKISWFSRTFDVNKERFFLSYETVVPGYASYNNILKFQICTSCSRNCTQDRMLVESDLFALMRRGTEYRYTWYIAGGVLTAPTVLINKFRCTESFGMEESITLVAYDAPLSVLEPALWEMDPSRMTHALVCRNESLNESLKSSIGDLTLIATMRNDYQIELNASVVFTWIPCNDAACNAVTYNISLGDRKQKGFQLLSQGTSQQRAIFWLSPKQNGSFITFGELEVRFEGFTHAPCAMGGLFLYQLEPLDLIGQVCSDWTAEIWSGALKQEDGTTRLHLDHHPVMFVIKTYKGFTEGRIKGQVMLGTCLGVIYPGFRQISIDSPYYRYSTHSKLLYHKGGCVIFQYFQTDDPYCMQPHRFSLGISHSVHENQHGEIQIGRTINMSAYPANLVLKYNMPYFDTMCRYRVCADGDCSLDCYRGWMKEKLFSYQTWGRKWGLWIFPHYCLAVGLKVFFRAHFVAVQHEFCWTSQTLRKYTSNFQCEWLPSVRCGTLLLRSNIRDDIFSRERVVRFTPPAVTNNLCCVLHLSVLANPLLNDTLHKITVDSYRPVGITSYLTWNLPTPVGLTSYLTWNFPTPFNSRMEKGINGFMHILKQVSFPLNSLYYMI